jgi:UPF0042 nucleotide-binding protein
MSTPAREIILVTGLSGAGKASILRVLEDLGFETVDNPPISILESLVGDGVLPLAAGIDARTRISMRRRYCVCWIGCGCARISRSH